MPEENACPECWNTDYSCADYVDDGFKVRCPVCGCVFHADVEGDDE